MSDDNVFVLDSDVFIAAKNAYYAFAICPGFWDSLIHHSQAGRVCSIDRVRGELLAARKTEDLVVWVKDTVPAGFFQDTDGEDVVNAYTQVMLWVQRNTQYVDQAKAKFAPPRPTAGWWHTRWSGVSRWSPTNSLVPRPATAFCCPTSAHSST
jgi:hypothetical protein